MIALSMGGKGLASQVVAPIAIILQLLLSGPVTNPSHALYYPYKLLHNASHALTLTPQEWASEFECNVGAYVGPLPSECYREDNSWLIKHNEEMWHSYRFLVHESSLDERYANLVYGFNSRSTLYYHHYKFNSGNGARDQRLAQYVAGAQVDDQLCKQHLKQMVELLDDLSSRVARKRARVTTTNQNSTSSDTSTKLDERHFRLARVLDSFGRYESGHLTGRYHSFGMYRQCIKTPLLLAPGEKLSSTRYCWSRLSLDDHLSLPLRNKNATDYNSGDFKYHMATCLPASCHTKSFAGDKENLALVQKIINTQYKRPRSMWLDQSLPVESVFCLVDPDSKVAQMQLGGWLFVAFISGWLGLCVLVTIARKRKHILSVDAECGLVASAKPVANRHRSFWSHFDLFDSWNEFLGSQEVERENAPVDLNTLSLVKVLANMAVFVCHSILMAAPLSANALEALAVMENNRGELLMLTGFLMIDALFVLTGLLMTFIVLKRLAKIDPLKRNSLFGLKFFGTWLFIAASRYLRLVPMYFLMFWFKKTVYTHLGSGPNWDYGLNKDTLIGACKQESWLSPFTPMTAFTPLLSQCLPPSWTISNDLLFAFLIPPFIIGLRKHFRATSVLIMLTIVGSILAGYYVTYLGIDAGYRFMLEQLTARGVIMMFRNASIIYSSPIYRVPAILIGVFAGYALFKYEQSYYERAAPTTCAKATSDEQLQLQNEGDNAASADAGTEWSGWPRWFRGFATQQAIIYLLLSFVYALFTKELRDYSSDATKHKLVSYFFLSAHSNFSLAIAIIFLRMITDWKGSWLMRLSSAGLFRALAKLAYPLLLFHWDILYYDAMSVTQSTLANKWQYGRAATLAYLLSVPLSLIAHLALENPLDKLTKTYILRAT